MFSIYWGEVSADSDGPVEWCKPVPQAEARALAEHYPELTLANRTGASRGVRRATKLVRTGSESSGALAARCRVTAGLGGAGAGASRVSVFQPEDLGLRITYLATGPVTETSVPDDYCDFAVPFRIKR